MRPSWNIFCLLSILDDIMWRLPCERAENRFIAGVEEGGRREVGVNANGGGTPDASRAGRGPRNR